MTREEPVTVELDADEKRLLMCALADCGGPAHLSEAMAVALGFGSLADLQGQTGYLYEQVRSRAALTPLYWRRLLGLAEIVFASDLFGSGLDWSITSGMSDEKAIKALRSLQRKLGRLGLITNPTSASGRSAATPGPARARRRQ
jgi:hypothetical protein